MLSTAVQIFTLRSVAPWVLLCCVTWHLGYIYTERKRTRKRNFSLIFVGAWCEQQFKVSKNPSGSDAAFAFAQYKRTFKTRMHSSGMRTVRSSSRLSRGLPQCMLRYQPPPPPGADLPPNQVTPPTRPPWRPVARHAGIPPAMHAGIAHPPWRPAARHAGIPPARHAGIPPPPCGQTHTCKNITFATSLRTVIITNVFPPFGDRLFRFFYWLRTFGSNLMYRSWISNYCQSVSMWYFFKEYFSRPHYTHFLHANCICAPWLHFSMHSKCIFCLCAGLNIIV